MYRQDRNLGLVALTIIALLCMAVGCTWQKPGSESGVKEARPVPVGAVLRRACRKELESSCTAAVTLKERVQCLSKSDKTLSEKCRNVVAITKEAEANRERRRQKFEAVKVACESDTKKLCPGKEATPVKCLNDHPTKLSPACMAAMDKLDPCFKDRQKLCPDTERSYKCLKQNEAKLSSACKQRWEAVADGNKRIRRACGRPIKEICGGAKGGWRQCMRENLSAFPLRCQAAYYEGSQQG